MGGGEADRSVVQVPGGETLSVNFVRVSSDSGGVKIPRPK